MKAVLVNDQHDGTAAEITADGRLKVDAQITYPLWGSDWVPIPGLSAVQYAAGDALGIKFSIAVPTSGTIQTALVTDLADQASLTDFILFDADFTGGTNNSAYDMTDADRAKFVGFVQVSTYSSFNDNAVGQAKGIGLDYIAPQGRLYVQAVTRGTPTYAIADAQLKLLIEP